MAKTPILLNKTLSSGLFNLLSFVKLKICTSTAQHVAIPEKQVAFTQHN